MKASALPTLTLLAGSMLAPGLADAQTVPAQTVPAPPVPTLAVPGDAASPAAPLPEQAKALERQVQGWLTQITAGVFALPDPMVRFTPDGGSYDIAVPLAPFAAIEPSDAAFTAKVHRLDATRWEIESEQAPPMLKLTLQRRVPDAVDPDSPDAPGRRPGRPKPGATPDAAAGTHLETVTYEAKIGAQTTTGVFDPTYATPSNTHRTIASIDLVQVGGPAATISHIGPTVSVSTTTPSGEGRSDLLLDTTMQHYETKTAAAADGTAVTLTVDRLHVATAVTALAQGKLVTLVGLAMDNLRRVRAIPAALDPVAPNAGAKPGAKPVTKPGATPGATLGATPKPRAADGFGDADRLRLRGLLVAANQLLTGFKLNEEADGLSFDVGGHVGTMTHLGISFAGDAPQDALTASMGLTLDGLALAELPPTLVGYVPSHFSIHPNVSNISVGALTKLGMDATAPTTTSTPGQRPPEADYATLFQHGGINLGFDALGLDVGDTKLTGTGSFNLAGPQTITGQAEITVHGLEALITKVQADPMVAQAVPVLIFLKGIAKTDADQSVWQISVAKGRALVNGVDLMAMMGGAR